MRTPAQIGGHPIHPMLVAIPIGLWIFSLAADFIAGRSASPETWQAAALYTMVGGIIGALAAAVPGLIDMLSLKDAAIKGTALKHMGLNLTIVALYAVNAWTRVNASVPPNVPVILSLIAIAMLLVSGWLGGKMVYEAGVAVHTDDVTSPQKWGGDRVGTRSTWTPSAGARGERAMAADAERPARGDTGESRPR